MAGENALKPKNGNILTEALLELKPGPQGPIIEQRYLELVPTWSHFSSFSPYRVNCGDWYPLDLGNFEVFLTNTNIAFADIIKPNFWEI